MSIVNHWYIWDAFAELEREEAEQGAPLGLDANDEKSMKKAFDSYVRPWVNRLKPKSRTLLMTTLAYFLQQPTFTGGEILANIQDLSMNRPDDERRIFEWMWLALFPEFNYEDVDTSGCTEDNDMMKMGELTEGMSVN